MIKFQETLPNGLRNDFFPYRSGTDGILASETFATEYGLPDFNYVIRHMRPNIIFNRTTTRAMIESLII